jgi:hypothetical protein
MKIIVSYKIGGGENVRFAIELPDAFGRYKPKFLTEYFTKAVLGAVMDLRYPRFLPMAMQMNKLHWHMKGEVVKNACGGVDFVMLREIMDKVDLRFIKPDGSCPEDWEIEEDEL